MVQNQKAAFEKWQLVLLPRSLAYSGKSPHFQEAYKAWHEAWEPVYQSVGVAKSLPSDAFTRQDERLAIFYDGKCAALSLFTYSDLSIAHHKRDSYFECWPELALKSLTRNGSRVLVCSAFTVAVEFRRMDFGFLVKDLLMGMLVRYFVESPFDVMTGNMRNSKNMNDLSYRWGATPLMKNVPVHGEPSDLVGFFKASVKPDANPDISKLMESLWWNRIGQNEEWSENRRAA